MTPIDDELRTSLRRQADGVVPLADPLAGVERRAGRIRRRRVATAVTGTALAVAAVAVAVPVGMAHLRTGSSNEGGYASGGSRPSTASTPATAPPGAGSDPRQLRNFVDWLPRGGGVNDPHERFDAEVGRLWSKAHHTEPNRSGINRLWSQRLPDGSWAGVWQLWPLESRTAYTVVGQRLPDGRTFIVLDQVTPKGVKEISSVLAGGAFPHVVVLGQPRTGQISYAADGRRFRPVEHLQGFVGGDGWAVFDRTGPAIGQKLPDLIEVLNGDGRQIYRGKIDVGSSFPDK